MYRNGNFGLVFGRGEILLTYMIFVYHCTEVRFTSFLSCGFITAIVVNPPEKNLTKRTSVHWTS